MLTIKYKVRVLVVPQVFFCFLCLFLIHRKTEDIFKKKTKILILYQTQTPSQTSVYSIYISVYLGLSVGLCKEARKETTDWKKKSRVGGRRKKAGEEGGRVDGTREWERIIKGEATKILFENAIMKPNSICCSREKERKLEKERMRMSLISGFSGLW